MTKIERQILTNQAMMMAALVCEATRKSTRDPLAAQANITLDMIEKAMCSNCKWHEGFAGVCTNGASVNSAEFTSHNHYCEDWEKEKNKNG